MKKVFIAIFLILIISMAGISFYWKRPTVSVVMSTYNRADLMPKAVQSILDQTYKDFEFIIVNDGSKDNTRALLKELAAKDKRIKVLENDKNRGLIYSLNRGIAAARGTYIARMDDDDFSLPMRLEKQVAYLSEHPEIAVLGSWFANNENLYPYPYQRATDPEKIKIETLLGYAPITHPSAVIRRSFLTKNHIEYKDVKECRSVEDRCFWRDIVLVDGKIASLPEVLLKVRFHTSNSAAYYMEQCSNTANLYYQLRGNFLTPEELKGPECLQLKRIVEVNRTKKVFDQVILEEVIYARCANFKGEEAIHPSWADAFIIKDKRACREMAPKECGDIVSRAESEFTLKWDEWGIETFVKNKEGIWVLKPVKPE